MEKILLILGLMICSNLVAQEAYKFKLEIGSGIEYGQWTINRGPLVGTKVDLIEKSKRAASIPISFSAAYCLNRINTGIELKNHFFLVSEVYFPGSSDGSLSFTPLSSNKYVNLTAFNVFIGFDIFHREIYRFGPRLSRGTFVEKSVYPEKPDNGPKNTYKCDLRNEVHFRKVYISIAPSFSHFRNGSNTEGFQKGTHKMYFLGLDVCCGFKL